MTSRRPNPDALRRGARATLKRFGFDVRRSDHVPFGVRWEDDLAFCLDGRPLGTVLDVGANVGQFSSQLLRRFPEASVHAFEPMPEICAALRRNFPGGQVTCVQAAVGEAAGTAQIARGAGPTRGGFHASGASVEVPVETIDGYVERAGIGGVDLLKIDTEGHELSVLAGAASTLDAGRVGHLLVECDFEHRDYEPHGDFTQILAAVAPRDFRVVAFYTGGVDDHGWRWGNVLLRRVDPAAPPRQVSSSPLAGRA